MSGSRCFIRAWSSPPPSHVNGLRFYKLPLTFQSLRSCATAGSWSHSCLLLDSQSPICSAIFPWDREGKQVDRKKCLSLNRTCYFKAWVCLSAGMSTWLRLRGERWGPWGISLYSQPGDQLKANSGLWIQSRAGIFRSLAHETPEEWVDLEFSLKKRRLRVI